LAAYFAKAEKVKYLNISTFSMPARFQLRCA